MGSTVVVALIQQEANGTYAWIGHIGDSRAYLVRAGRLHRLTIDHSAVQAMLSRNLITPEEAQNHPDSSVLTRSLGHKPEVEIDIEQHPLAVGDTLLLCSDGLWGFVREQEILRVADNPGLTVEAAAHDLLELALAVGGHDNIGIEMARLIQPPDLPPQKTENYIALKVVLAMLLLAFVAVCVLGFLLFFTGN
jgi:protein phosphatase